MQSDAALFLEWDRDALRPRYRNARAGFAMIAAAMALRTADAGSFLAMYLFHSRALYRLIMSHPWDWAVRAPISPLMLVGSYLLLGCWDDRGWRVRSLILAFTSAAGGALWVLFHGQDLGLSVGDLGHEWFRFQLHEGLRWVQFLMAIRLGAAAARHTGTLASAADERAPLGAARLGTGLWVVGFLRSTEWSRGWPLVHRPGPWQLGLPLGLPLYLATLGFRVAASLHAARLCWRAAQGCGQVYRELRAGEDGARGGWASPYPWDAEVGPRA